MFENNINELMSEFNNFKLSEVCYLKCSKILCLIFITKFEDNNDEISKLENAIKTRLNLDIDYKFKYKVADNSFDSFYAIISKYLKEKYNYTNFNSEDFVFNSFQNNISIKIKVDNDYYTKAEVFNLKDELKSEISKYSFSNIDLTIVPRDENVIVERNVNNILQTRNTILSKEEVYKEEKKTFKISGLDIIVGKNFTDIAFCLNQIKGETEFIQVAGVVKFLNERTFTKKSETNDGEGVEKVFYTFELVDGFGKIHASYFPTKAYLEGEKKLEDGQVVTICGKIELYRENLSLKVKEIAYCCLPEHQVVEKQDRVIEEKVIDSKHTEIENVVFKPEPDNYSIVFPEDYKELDQMDMFSMVSSPKKLPSRLVGKDYVVFDLETTGLDYTNCEILEIGAVKIRNGKIIETFQTLCKPFRPIPSDATGVNGITDEMVKDAPKFEEIVGDFYKFTRGSTLVAHNANFDTTFLDYHAVKYGYKFDNMVLDTLEMSRRLVKGLKKYKLGVLAEYFNISLVNAHRALFDTIATAKVFIELCRLEDR